MSPLGYLTCLPNCSVLVAKLLDLVKEILSFRQVCRSVINSPIYWFASLFFKECSVSLQRRSLEILLEVSRHAIFHCSVTTLGISLAYVPGSPNLSDIGLRYHDGNEKSDPEADASSSENDSNVEQETFMAEETEVKVDKQAYERYVKDQTHMRESGMGTAYLTQALAALPACKTIILHDSCYIV
ncbi:hypothetical protein F4809DRAFT_621660 [Biscogniauxia mediterranea]|nr:hypothetical protein F4809DRAFT_621660 [Biscogniauxia mediterranea]